MKNETQKPQTVSTVQTTQNTQKIDEWRSRELGGLYKQTKKNDPNSKYLTGKLTIDGKVISVIIFPNKGKAEKAAQGIDVTSYPDLTVYRQEVLIKDKDKPKVDDDGIL